LNPLVSIITPSYNQAAFLEDTLRSVLVQDYTPLEYIVVDGASTDGSVEIIQRYAGRLAWWVSEPDSGQAEAINKGLQHAKGEIVAWLNSDDLYLPSAISRAVAVLGSNPSLGLVYGDALTIDAQGSPTNLLRFGNWGLAELMNFRIICQPTVFMRRSVLEKAGYLDRSYHFMLDHHLWARIACLAPVQYIGGARPLAPLAAARYHPGAKNFSQAQGFGNETLRMLAWMQTQSDLAPLAFQNRRRVLGGAYRLNARYLLDGGLARQSLGSYWKALLNWPGFALKHWHRMLYAMLCLIGLNPLIDRLRTSHGCSLSAFAPRTSRARLIAELLSSPLNHEDQLESWPGLKLS
jgi:glycosyltransferase involved in cell wall biosynthesis